jgi:hypothetical protein
LGVVRGFLLWSTQQLTLYGFFFESFSFVGFSNHSILLSFFPSHESISQNSVMDIEPF